MSRTALMAAVICLSIAPAAIQEADAQSSADYEVIFATVKALPRQLEAAAREGYACHLVAQPEPGTVLQGVVVLLLRTEAPPASLAHRVLTGGRLGSGLPGSLESAGNDGFGLCGVVLDEEASMPSVIAVMSRSDATSDTRRYGVEVLTNYKDSLVRLNEKGREGFYPIASAPIDDNRVPEMRSWLVVTEQLAERDAPREIAVRSNSGAGGLQRALNEQGTQGYRLDLLWKEGNDVVAMMTRPVGYPPELHAFAVDTTSLEKLHAVSHVYLADAPFNPTGDRLVVSDPALLATNDIEDDALPQLNSLGYADGLTRAGDHISRHHGATPVAARVRRLPDGSLRLTTILVQRQ